MVTRANVITAIAGFILSAVPTLSPVYSATTQAELTETQAIRSLPTTSATFLKPEFMFLTPSKFDNVTKLTASHATILNLLSTGKTLFAVSFDNFSTQPHLPISFTAMPVRTPLVQHLDALGFMWDFRLPRIYLPMRHTRN
ncbi:hypothetical protein ROA7450_02201 [Roseovarius albus]|uniref:Uncharacterized protein n=1 Tax=Roseovarius albus TaxID=1247867 RepID=A0A1X6ZAC7_9RHOB|nr:hypothetical protein [Roseovarius albus]SLN45531.1 hypothetical protein ROA7450_02201 [Roseovarius albus]